MKTQWEEGIKPQYKPGDGKKQYNVRIPPEFFKDESEYNDASMKPHIKNARIQYTR